MIGQLLSALQRNTDRRQGFDPFAELLGMRPPGGPDSGRWGDYVHNQEGEFQVLFLKTFKFIVLQLWIKLSHS